MSKVGLVAVGGYPCGGVGVLAATTARDGGAIIIIGGGNGSEGAAAHNNEEGVNLLAEKLGVVHQKHSEDGTYWGLGL